MSGTNELPGRVLPWRSTRTSEPLTGSAVAHAALRPASAGEGPEGTAGLSPTLLQRHPELTAAMVQTAQQAKPAHHWTIHTGDLWCPDCGKTFPQAELNCADRMLCESCIKRPAVITWNGFDLCASCVDDPDEDVASPRCDDDLHILKTFTVCTRCGDLKGE